MKKIARRTLLIFFTAWACSPAIAGSGNRTGTNGAAELLIPTGTADIALAGSTVATTTGVDALFTNPAGVAKSGFGVSLSASHMSYIADIGVESAGLAANLQEFGAIALQLKALSVGDIPITTTTNPDGTGATFKPQFFTIGLTYSRRLTDRVSVGATATLISETMAEVSATGVAFNMGVIYDNLLNLRGFSIGVVVKNIGPQMQFDGPGLIVQARAQGYDRSSYMYTIEAASFELPSTIELGMGYRTNLMEVGSLLFAGSFQNNNYSDDEYKIGLEYTFQNVIALRGGYVFAPPQNEQLEHIFGLSLGAGVHYMVGSVDIAFDYAYRATEYFNNNHVFSVTLGL
jgi:hypothetical protein